MRNCRHLRCTRLNFSYYTCCLTTTRLNNSFPFNHSFSNLLLLLPLVEVVATHLEFSARGRRRSTLREEHNPPRSSASRLGKLLLALLELKD